MRLDVLLALAGASFLLALWLTGLLRSYALRAKLMDEVNERSSHTRPTPRGGGVSIVVTATLGVLVSMAFLGFPPAYATGLIGGGLAIALVGWLDDHGHLAPSIRLVTHMLGAIWLVAWVGPLSVSFLPLPAETRPFIEWVVSVLILVWMVNLFNFMDGIDGIAASQAASVALAGALMLFVANAAVEAAAPSILLAAAVLGFLVWNWPPAKIFMGDASSGFLGFMLAALAIVVSQSVPELGAAWLILPAVFIADATTTLFVRMICKQRLSEAHRSHAYQKLSRRLGAHLPVTLATLAVTWFWLVPIAAAVTTGLLHPVTAVLIAFAPLVAAVLLVGGGVPTDD
jgi:Fuc2NAc and GlcNAc transferase